MAQVWPVGGLDKSALNHADVSPISKGVDIIIVGTIL